MPSTAQETTTTTSMDLPKSIFNAPPGSVPSRPIERIQSEPLEAEAPHGTKRVREEEEESEDEAAMEENEESDAPMEASSEED